MDTKQFIFGLLTIILMTGVAYITFNDEARLKITTDDATFYVKDSRWLVGGVEELRLFDGNKQLYRDVSNIRLEYFFDDGTTIVPVDESFNYNNQTTGYFIVKRTTPYKRGPVIIATYYFDISVKDIEDFPTILKIEVINGTDKFLRYTVDRLTDAGEKRKLTGETELSFGRNMKVNLNPNYRWAWIGWPYGSDSISAQYDVPSDYEIYYFRFYDPTGINLYFNTFENTDVSTEDGSTVTLKGVADDSTATVCLSADIDSLGDDFACDVGTVTYDWNTSSENNKFSDGTTEQTISFTSSPEEKSVEIESFINASILKKDSSFHIKSDETVYENALTSYLENSDSQTCSGTWDTTDTCANTYDDDNTTKGSTTSGNSATAVYEFSCSSCTGTIEDVRTDIIYTYGYGTEYKRENISDLGCDVENPDIKVELTSGLNSVDAEMTVYCADDSGTYHQVSYDYLPSGYGGDYDVYEVRVVFYDRTIEYYTPSNAPYNTKIDFQDDGTVDSKIVGYLGKDYAFTNSFYEGGVSASSVEFDFGSPHTTKTTHFKVTKDFNCSVAYYNISGDLNGDMAYIRESSGYYTASPFKLANGDVPNIYYATYVSNNTDDTVYVIGGKNDYNALYKIDDALTTGTMTQLTDITYDAGSGSCAVYDPVNSQYFIMGGKADTTYKSDVVAYDPSTDSYTTKTSMTNPLARHGCVYKDGAIYVYGGYTTGDATTYSKSLYKYNISADTWTALSDSTTGTTFVSLVDMGNGELFAMGYPLNKPQLYNISADTWSYGSVANIHGTYLYGASAVKLKDYIYYMGGENSSNEHNPYIYRYNISVDSWDTLEDTLYASIGTTLDIFVQRINNILLIPNIYVNYGYRAIISFYPTDVKVTIGDSTIQTYQDAIIDSQTSSNFHGTVTSYISSCTKESDGSCLIPIKVYNNGIGKVTLSDLKIVSDISDIGIGSQIIDCGVNSSCTPDISLYTEQDGTVTISNLSLKFYGSDNITITAEDVNNSYSTSNVISNYFTNYSYELPAGASAISFYPFYINYWVKPFGQFPSTPVLDITSKIIDGTGDLYFKIVNPSSCINLKYYVGSTEGTYSDVTNDTWIQVYSDESDGYNTGIFLEGEYTCSSSFTGYFSPDIYLRSCEHGVDICNAEVS